MDDYPFLSKDGSRLHVQDKVAWYSKRYKSWVEGSIEEMRTRLRGYRNVYIVTKITVKVAYPGNSYPSWVVIKPDSVTRIKAV